MHPETRGRRGKRGISQVIAVLLLIISLVALVIVVYVFSISLLGGGLQTQGISGVNVTILPYMYSPEANVGVLNENANFSIAISNSLPVNQRIVVGMSTGSSTMQSATYLVRSGETTTQQISQKLNSTGIWTVKLTSNATTLASYSFDVKPNRDAADFAVSQWREQRFYRYLTWIAAGGAALSFLMSIIALARKGVTKIVYK